VSLLRSLRGYGSYGVAIPGFVKHRLSVEEARAQVRQRLNTREQRFLEVLDRCIFAHPGSPYLPLLKAAGCEMGDIRKMVGSDGLEATLDRLRREGVYFTFEEFKGRETVRRGGLSLSVSAGDFDNPAAPRHYSKQTGGTTGRATRVWMNLDFWAETAVVRLLGLEAHGLVRVPSARWRRGGPSSVASMVNHARLGRDAEQWFIPRTPQGTRETLRNVLAKNLITYAARLGGLRLPKPIPVYPDDGLPVALWARDQLSTGGRCLIRTSVSNAVRVSIAAIANGIDLTGASIMGNGEPPTPAKVEAITRSGANWIPTYGFSEGGRVGTGCVDPVDGTDVHLYHDGLALIQYPRAVSGSDVVVDAFNFTSLSLNAPKVLLNVESDDFGTLERRSCGCPLEEIGFDRHLRNIFSFGKLTGEGVTLVGSDMVRILEEVLPSRFGGSPLDYQLIEEEDARSFTRLVLLVSPRVRLDDEASVVQTVLNELDSGDRASSMAGKIWDGAGTLTIRRGEPVATARGKLMPLHLSRQSGTA
jgi:hypothetical protein